ncbi:ribulokinase [Poriferisphaera corsica]|nr:ribulokinase [Poriferisphaera corsica]
MNKNGYAIGVDYGTNSVRALIVDVSNGREIASAIYHYPSGDAGILLDPHDPNVARQNPADYIAGFMASVNEAVTKAMGQSSFDVKQVVGLGIDSTGSTPLPVDRTGLPLAFQEQFKNDLNAQAWLWKDHTSYMEAAEITEKAAAYDPRYLCKCGGTYSSEWYWSKILHCKRIAPEVFEAAYAWVELCDFIPGYITDQLDPNTMPRSICAAGHKAMYHEDWDGLPSEAFLAMLDPDLAPLRERYAKHAITCDQEAGKLSKSVALKVGLPAGLPIAVGAFDAHTGAVGAGIKQNTLVKIVGTSTCDMMVSPLDHHLPDIPGLCGIVPGSIVPGMYGMEAGQSAVGDIFNWFVNHISPGTTSTGDRHIELTEQATKLTPGQSGLLALDWNNGNRTVLVDPQLSGLLIGQTLHTKPCEIYRALIEATAFGARKIIERWETYDVPVHEVINCGGISEKNRLVMQIYADVCNKPMKISASDQTCALGAAMFGAIVGKTYKNVQEAAEQMTRTKEIIFEPITENVAVYEELYQLYTDLHDAFGIHSDESRHLYHVMKKLIVIRENAVTKGKAHV